MPPTLDERLYLFRVARGLEKADLLIRDGNVVNVYSGEVLPANVAVARGRIAYVRPVGAPVGPAAEVITAEGFFLSPGYIEPHGHPWVIYNPLSLSEAVLPLGTTSFIMDDLAFFQHGGVNGFCKMLEALQDCSSRFYWVVRAVPQSPLHNENELFSPDNIRTLLELPQVVGVAEITRWGALLDAEPSLMEKVSAAVKAKKRIDGHTAGCKNDALNSLAALGIQSCHEPISSDEVLQRLRLGIWVMLRNSSLRPDLDAILPDLLRLKISLERVMMTTDAAEPTFVHKNGFVDGLIRAALKNGVDPITAIKMATLNPASFYGLEEDLGGIAPGRFADILLLKDLREPSPEAVISGGKIAAWQGKLKNERLKINWDELGFASDFQKPAWLDTPAVFAPPGGEVPVIKVVSSGITRLEYLQWDGKALPEGVQFCSLMGRKGEFLSSCFISGFTCDLPALSCSFTTSMGVLVLGSSLKAMGRAAARLFALGGGIVLCGGDSTIEYEMPLPIAGMMSPLELREAVQQLERLNEIMFHKGFKHNDLLLSLLFLSCDFLPQARITPYGVLDVKKRSIIFPALFIKK